MPLFSHIINEEQIIAPGPAWLGKEDKMDISSLKTQYESLRSEIENKASLLKSLDGGPEDNIPEEGDLFVKDCQLQCGGETKLYTGRVVMQGQDGVFQAADIEEKSGDGAVTRYLYEKKADSELTTERILFKTDTHKLKAEVVERKSAPPEVILEEIRFVEAQNAPEIDLRSEKLRKSVLEMADRIQLINDTGADLDKSPDIISIKDAAISSQDGRTLSVSGKVVRNNGQGTYSTIELTVSRNGEDTEEYYFSRGSDSDYCKKTESDRMESAQIFDRAEPKLVLFSQEHRFSL